MVGMALAPRATMDRPQSSPAGLVARIWYTVSGSYSVVVPQRGVYALITVVAAGGGADTNLNPSSGLGGPFARDRVRVIGGETLVITVGAAGISGHPPTLGGESNVMRGSQKLVAIAPLNYAPFLSGLGAVLRAGNGPISGSDLNDTNSLRIGGLYIHPIGGMPGQGAYSNSSDYVATVAGDGLVCMEFFDSDPGAP